MASKASKKATPPQDASKKRSKPSVAKVNVNGPRAESPSADGAGSNSGEGGYLREIEKRVRSTSKKLTAMQKVISLVAEHPDTPIDELVSKNIINKDQREQYLKKPELEKQLAQLHEQREQFTKFEEDLKRQFDAEKQSLRDKFEADLEAARADTSRDRDAYLILSKFLCAAASRRNEADENEPETQAFEGLLLAFYNGNVESVDAMQKLVAASEDIVPSTNGEATGVTYARVKELSAPHGYEPETQANGVTAETESGQDIAAKLEGATISDPTVTHAGLTETEDIAQAGSAVSEAVQAGGPEVTAVDEGAANAAAADQWDESKTANVADSMGESWVAVPRDASEVESQATGSAAGGQTQAWADEPMPVAPAPAIHAEPAAAANDGFHEVHHNRAGRRGGGGPRGGRGGGHSRGRGDGSRGRGRGGESRGGRGRGGRGRGD